LTSSLATRFVSDKTRDWSPDTLSDSTKADILSALDARWATWLAYAQVKSAIFDLVWSADKSTAYRALTRPAPMCDSDRRAVLRKMAHAPGRLAASQHRILDIISWLDDSEEELDLFVGGFIEVRHKRSGDVSILFQTWRQRRRLTTDEVRSRGCELCRDLTDARDVLQGATQLVAAH
jgi:hypothetical protein